MKRRFAIQLIAAAAALYFAAHLIPSVTFIASPGRFALAAAVLALVNTCIKPLLNLIALPLRLLTLGLFGIILNAAIIWGLDIVFPELVIPGILPLVYTTIIAGIASSLADKVS